MTFNIQRELSIIMEDKVVLEDLLKIKKLVDQMNLLEFKSQWHKRGTDYIELDPTERLKYLVMSIKIFQAKTDLKRTISSIKELSNHPEPEKAIHYYLRTNLWKFLDNFRYILLAEDIDDEDKLNCMDILDELAENIAQDEEFTQSCLNRLHKLYDQIRDFQNELSLQQSENQKNPIYQQFAQRIAQLIYDLDPSQQVAEFPSTERLSTPLQKLIRNYISFSVSRISIEKSGVLSIIQLLYDHPEEELEAHQAQLQETLKTLEQQVLYDPTLSMTRNQCAYALIVLLEILKMHRGLPVLLARILGLCSYIQFPAAPTSLDKELKELKGRITEIAQKKLRPIIEEVLWKNPTYLTKVPHIRITCPWCYRKDRRNMLAIKYIRKVVTSSFDRIEAVPGGQFNPEGVSKSRLSEIIVELLGLLVNLEPSPHFLRLHSQDMRMLRQIESPEPSQANSKQKLFEKQYATYKNHLKFLQDSIDYYQGISEKMKVSNTTTSDNGTE